MPEVRPYATWYADTIRCEATNHDCDNCPVMQMTCSLKPWEGRKMEGHCAMPWVIAFLKRNGVKKPNALVESKPRLKTAEAVGC